MWILYDTECNQTAGAVRTADRQSLEKEDEIYTTNRLIELFGLDSPEVQGEQAGGAAQSQTKTADEACHGHACTAGETSRTQVDETGNLEGILKEMLDYAAEKGMLAADSVVYRDLFDTKIMGLLMPRPAKSSGSSTIYIKRFLPKRLRITTMI